MLRSSGTIRASRISPVPAFGHAERNRRTWQLLLVCGELVLSFQFQLKLGLLQLLLQLQVLVHEFVAPFTLAIQLTVQSIDRVATIVSGTHQRPNHGTAQVRAMAYIAAGIFVFGVKAKRGRRPVMRQFYPRAQFLPILSILNDLSCFLSLGLFRVGGFLVLEPDQ